MSSRNGITVDGETLVLDSKIGATLEGGNLVIRNKNIKLDGENLVLKTKIKSKISYYMPVKLNGNPIINFRVDPVENDYEGSDLTEAKFWYNTTSHKLKFFDGTEVRVLAIGEALETVLSMASEATEANTLLVSAGIGRSVKQFVPGENKGGMLTISDAGVVGTKSILDSSSSIGLDSTDNQVPTALAVNNAINSAITSMGSFVGDFDASFGNLPVEGSGSVGEICKGDYWRVSVAGSIVGLSPVEEVEIGDVIVAKFDNADSAEGFFVLQSNIDNAVTNSGSVTDLSIAIFDGTSGRVIKGSGVTIDASGNANIPSGAVYKINGVAHSHNLNELSDNVNGLTIADIEAKTDKYQAEFSDTDWAGDTAPYSISVLSLTHGLKRVTNVQVLDAERDFAGVAVTVDSNNTVNISSMEKFAGSYSLISTVEYSAS